MPHTTVFDDLASLAPLTAATTASTQAVAPLSSTMNARADDMHKFGTLFSPSTPRASPEGGAMPLPDHGGQDESRQVLRQESHKEVSHRRAPSTSSQSSDFGAFVSVSSFDDPLSGNAISDDFPDMQKAIQDDAHATPASRSTSRSTTRSSAQPNTTANSSTLSFFDQFASDARERSNVTRNLVLDELLLHQDDPMYFLAEGADKNLPKTPATSSTITQETPVTATPMPLSPTRPVPPPKSPRHGSKAGTPQPPTTTIPTLPPPPTKTNTPATVLTPNYLDPGFNIQQDLDHSYFSTPPPPPVEHIIDLGPIRQQQDRVGRPSRTLHPRRSQSLLVAEPRLAAPVTSPEGALRSLDESRELGHMLHEDFFTQSPPNIGSSPPPNASSSPGMQRSPSSNSLSTSIGALPAKWMSTLLRGGSAADGMPHQQARPTLESIFSHDEQAQAQRHRTHAGSPSEYEYGQSSQSQSHGWRKSYAPQQTQTPSNQPVTFTHGSAFGPRPPVAGTSFSSPNYLGTSGVGGAPGGGSGSMMSVTSAPSPFGPHVYVPPSGAPGFLGESYTWDKGYSEELEAELRRESERQGPSGSSGTVSGASRSDAVTRKDAGDRTDSGSTDVSRGHQSSSMEYHSKRDGTHANDISRGPTSKGSDGGWGSALFGFGSMRAKTGAVSSSRSSGHVPHYKDLPGASVSEGNLHGRGHAKSPGSDAKIDLDRDVRIGDFFERKAGNVELVGRRLSTTPVLTPELAGQIRSYLPALSRLSKKWTLIYSLDQDGISLTTLYTRCEAHAARKRAPGEIMANNAAMLLVVKDADDAIFGAWIAEGVRYIKGGKGYYGGGESFLWKYVNDTLKVFKSTGKNKYIALCEPEYISCGGGDGHYGFYLDSTLFDGSSAPCPTFDNEPLCSPGPKKGVSVAFECVGLEVWGMVS